MKRYRRHLLVRLGYRECAGHGWVWTGKSAACPLCLDGKPNNKHSKSLLTRLHDEQGPVVRDTGPASELTPEGRTVIRRRQSR